MIPASDAYKAAEAQKVSALPVALFTLKAFPHATGVGAGQGTFVNCAFVAPDRVQTDVLPASWTSEVLVADLGRYPAAVVFTVLENPPGFYPLAEFRSAPTTALLAAAAWSPVASGDTVYYQAFYQWRYTWTGFRAWAVEDPADTAGGLAAYAVEDPDDPYASYASDTLNYPDRQAYFAAALFLGDYPLPLSHIMDGGEVAADLSTAFGQVVTGDHTLILDNRHGRYSSRKSTFIWPSPTAWKGKELVGELGFIRPGGGGRIIDAVTVWRGLLYEWGRLERGMGDGGKLEAHNIALYSKGLLADLLEKPLGAADADGMANPLFYGQYLAQADQVQGWTPFPPEVSLDFEAGNLYELDHIFLSGGLLEVTDVDPEAGLYSLRSRLTGANQQAYGTKSLHSPSNTLFFRQKWRWKEAPASPADSNLKFLQVFNAAGSLVFYCTVNAAGKVVAWLNGATKETDWALEPFLGLGVGLVLAITSTKVLLWVNNDQVLKWTEVSPGQVQTVSLGLNCGATAETWEVLIDQAEAGPQYLEQAYRVGGGPFRSLGTIYIDGVTRTANVDRYPEYGVVNFTDGANEVSGQVEVWVDKDDKTHFADQIQDLIEVQANRLGFLDAVVLAAAKAATPEYVTACRFDDTTIGEALNALGKANLLNIIEDHGVIKVIPYVGTPPAASGLELRSDQGQLKAVSQAIKSDDRKNRVVVQYGRGGSTVGLSEIAQDLADIAENGEKAETLDLSFGQPVATNNRTMARLVVQRLFLRLAACRDVMEAVSWLEAARAELGDGVGIFDDFILDALQVYGLFGKRLPLGPVWRSNLTLIDFLE